jgi:hypothetical protein
MELHASLSSDMPVSTSTNQTAASAGGPRARGRSLGFFRAHLTAHRYDVSRAERTDSSAARELTAAERASMDLARRDRAQSRDETARLRDQTARTRDHAAEARDHAAESQTKALLGDRETGDSYDPIVRVVKRRRDP